MCYIVLEKVKHEKLHDSYEVTPKTVNGFLKTTHVKLEWF